MKSHDELIWAYLDKQCTEAEEIAVRSLIENDPGFGRLFSELQMLHRELADMETESPSMSFTRNVMEGVKLEPVPVTLKTRVSRAIVYGIAAFFALSIFSIFAYAVIHAEPGDMLSNWKPNLSVETERLMSPGLLKVMIGLDVLLALIGLDRILRHKKAGNGPA
ncbi:hypothetical protein [Pedobacter sp. SYP-B3415]|uniref:hypothetical protein n=1 Tax=Pedobacter sp. SYP-B3415 TaxID=2496641 RepID=UPI00101C4B02|nr:hypothetical protein [Pedobacter sp. SYP-B3415]